MNSWLGIDVGKETLVVVLQVGEQPSAPQPFENTPGGIQALGKWLKRHKAQAVTVCLEATGLYGLAVATALHQAGHQVHVVNPAAVAAYAESRLRRNKTDGLDARLLVDFCRSQSLPVWSPPDPAWYELRELVRLLDDLEMMRQQEQNRLQAGVTSATVKTTLQHHLAFLEQHIAALKTRIQDHLDGHPDLKRDQDLLDSIPGIGPTTAFRLLAEIPDIRAFDTAAQLVAFAGLNPRHHQSGKFTARHTPISKLGNPAIRKALYFPAIAAKNHNPTMRAFCERILQRNPVKMVAVVAAMRKLLVWAFAILKSGKPFVKHKPLPGT